MNKYCPNCENEIKENDIYCKNCGVPINLNIKQNKALNKSNGKAISIAGLILGIISLAFIILSLIVTYIYYINYMNYLYKLFK